MSSFPAPPTLDELGDRPFSFYPPILNVEHNEWRLVKGSWSEVHVRNAKIDLELWIPRTYLGEISRIDEPVMIVGLRRELEYKGGTVWPYERRVVAMPASGTAVPRAPLQPAGAPPAPVSELRRQEAAESSVGKLIGAALLIGIFACFLVVVYFRMRSTGGRVEYQPVLQAELGLLATDDYHDVVRKLGVPARDRWRSETGERQYRALTYTDKNLTVILMGPDRKQVVYIGAKDRQWRTIHSVRLPGGGNTDSILRALPRF